MDTKRREFLRDIGIVISATVVGLTVGTAGASLRRLIQDDDIWADEEKYCQLYCENILESVTPSDTTYIVVQDVPLNDFVHLRYMPNITYNLKTGELKI